MLFSCVALLKNPNYSNLTVTILTVMFLKFSEAKNYHSKLVNIRNEMMMLHEKTSKLKVSGVTFLLCNIAIELHIIDLVFILDACSRF